MYNDGKMKEKKKELEGKVRELEEEMLCIGGDFNARIGKEGKRFEESEEKEKWRNSRDKEVNREGKELLRLIEDRGWEVGNGNLRGDERGEFTYTGGRGDSVIDYVIVNQGAWDRIEKLTVGKRVESDHQPLELEVRGEFRRETGRAQEVIKDIVQWSEESIEEYKKKEREIMIEGEKVEELWNSVKIGIEECIVRKRIRLRRKKIGEKDWWDAECKRWKKEGI